MARTPKISQTKPLYLALLVAVVISARVAQINSSVADQEARDNREKFCEGIDVNYTLMTDQEIEIQRNKDINLFHKSTDLLKELIKTKDYELIWNGTLWLPILITVVFALSIVSLLLYLFNIFICCKRTKSASSGFCVKLNLCFAVLAMVIFLIAIIAMSIFISNARSSIKYVNCSMNIMNDDLRNGADYTEAEIKFQGMLPLKNIFVAYGQTLNTLVNNHPDNVNDIVGLNLPTLAKTAADNIDPFYNKFKDETTANPDGTQQKPSSVTSLLPAGKIAMDDEFSQLYNASLHMHQGALVAKSVIDTGDSAIFESAINSASEELEQVLQSMSKYIDLSNEYFGTVSDKYDAVQIVYIVFNFICLIIAIVIVVGLCTIYHRDKCKMFVLWRILIFVIGIFCVFFFAATIVIAGLSFATSSSCQVFRELHTDEGIDDFVETFEVSDRFKTVLKTCYSETASGELGNVFLKDNATNSPEFQVYNDSKTMLSVYERYETEVAKLDPLGNSKTTQDLDDALEKIRIGINEDFSNVFSTLGQLNDLVECDNFYYALTPNTCSSDSAMTCKTIQVETAVTIPICLSGQGTVKTQEATDLFDKTKAYLTETQTLMGNMIDDVNGTKTTSLNSQFKVAALAYLEGALLFDKIKEDQKDVLSTFSGDLNGQTDCRIVRLHLQIVEDAICFNTVAELYAFMVASFIGAVFFFCFVWNLCCAEYCLWNELEGEEKEDIEIYENNQAQPIIMPTEPNNDVAEDDFFINNAQGGYINDSESGMPQNPNIEYKANEDDFVAPTQNPGKGGVQ